MTDDAPAQGAGPAADPVAPSAPPGATDPKRRTSSAQLAGIGVFLAAAWAISFVLGAVPEGVRVAAALAGGVVAPSLATAAAVQLSGPALRLTRDRGYVIMGLATAAFCSLALVALSFSSGMDDADAARPAGVVGALTLVFAVASVLAFASAIALVFFAVLRSRGLAVRPAALISSAVGVVTGPFVAWTFLSPIPVVLLCAAVFALALVPRGRSPHFAATTAPPATAAADLPRLRARVTFFAAVSLAGTLIVWITGLGISIAGTGTEAATVGLGLAAAVGQLAVIPLLWAVYLVVSARSMRPSAPADPVRAGFVGASVLVAASAGTMVAGTIVAGAWGGGAMFVPLTGVLSFGVGVFAGAVVWPATAGWPTPARAATTAVAVVGVALLYAVLVAFSGGVTLALASGFIAFGGARYLVRTPRTATVSPTTPAAS